MREVYSPESSLITGKLSRRNRLSFRNILVKSDIRAIFLFMTFLVLALFSTLSLLIATQWSGITVLTLSIIAIISVIEMIRFLQVSTLAVFAVTAKDPIPMQSKKGLRVAVLTTIVPGKEPLDLVAETLQAMKNIRPGNSKIVDVWLLDEGNDPTVRRRCKELGVKHFSRKGVAEWNTASGAHKAKTKHGNHNAWRSKYEKNYDVVAQMDPDHIPRQNFLQRTLGYFNDPSVAFVVAPQVYGNSKESWIARASAFQAYIFHGIIQRGGNGLGAPLLIGTNHLYRTSAFAQINGYQDCIIEDHLTSMVVYGSKDSFGRGFKGVYTPDILAVGEGPTSYTDYFNQQKRWAYGIWEILLTATPKVLPGMSRNQQLTFVMLQFFYPSVAVSWVASALLAILVAISPLSLGELAAPLVMIWIASFTVGIGFFLWLRKFNLVSHERRDWGVQGMGLLLMCIPVYVNAAIQAILRRPLTYAVTAKGKLTSPDTLMTFAPHINWIAISFVTLLFIVMVVPQQDFANAAWTVERIAVCASPLVLFGLMKLNESRFSLQAIRMIIARRTIKPTSEV